MVDAMAGSMHQMIHDECMKDKDKLPPDCEATEDKSFEEALKAFPWDEMIQAEVPVYQKHFTEGDINALIAFYSTPTGQKALRETPAIAADAMQAIMPLMEKQMGAIQQQTQQEIAQMMKDSDAKPDRR